MARKRDSAAEMAEWPPLTAEEKIYYDILFFSQGPSDGLLLGERARDLFLHSMLPLPTLSQIWNLSDVSCDNLLDAGEFALHMYFMQCSTQRKKLPKNLPKHLHPPKSPPTHMMPLNEREQTAYTKIYDMLISERGTHLEVNCARDVLRMSGLSTQQLTQVWDLSDIHRDGQLDQQEWTVACHLIRMMKKGYKFDGPVNVFTYLPERIYQDSLQAKKNRIAAYERRKQKFMTLMEKKKTQSTREHKRLKLRKERLNICQKARDILSNIESAKENVAKLDKGLERDREAVANMEKVVGRLDQEHKAIRQETVKLILEDKKLQPEQKAVKEEVNEIFQRNSVTHNKATKDPDPFHELYENRKEKKIPYVALDDSKLFYPFDNNPFRKDSFPERHRSGSDLFKDCNNDKLDPWSQTRSKQEVTDTLCGFEDQFVELLTGFKSSEDCVDGSLFDEEDTVFKTVPVMADEDDLWCTLDWSCDHTAANQDASLSDLHRKLVDLKMEMQKLNNEGKQIIFKNPEDYTTPEKPKEEEVKSDKTRTYTRRTARNGTDVVIAHHSCVEPSEETLRARDYRHKRRSLVSEQTSDIESTPTPPVRHHRRSRRSTEKSEDLKSPESKTQGSIVQSSEESEKTSLDTSAVKANLKSDINRGEGDSKGPYDNKGHSDNVLKPTVLLERTTPERPPRTKRVSSLLSPDKTVSPVTLSNDIKKPEASATNDINAVEISQHNGELSTKTNVQDSDSLETARVNDKSEIKTVHQNLVVLEHSKSIPDSNPEILVSKEDRAVETEAPLQTELVNSSSQQSVTSDITDKENTSTDDITEKGSEGIVEKDKEDNIISSNSVNDDQIIAVSVNTSNLESAPSTFEVEDIPQESITEVSLDDVYQSTDTVPPEISWERPTEESVKLNLKRIDRTAKRRATNESKASESSFSSDILSEQSEQEVDLLLSTPLSELELTGSSFGTSSNYFRKIPLDQSSGYDSDGETMPPPTLPDSAPPPLPSSPPPPATSPPINEDPPPAYELLSAEIQQNGLESSPVKVDVTYKKVPGFDSDGFHEESESRKKDDVPAAPAMKATASQQKMPQISNSEEVVSHQKTPKISDSEEVVSHQKTPKIRNSEEVVSHQKTPMISDSEEVVSHQKTPMISDSEEAVSHQKTPKISNSEEVVSHQKTPKISDSEEVVSHQKTPKISDNEEVVLHQKTPKISNNEEAVSHQKTPKISDSEATASHQKTPKISDSEAAFEEMISSIATSSLEIHPVFDSELEESFDGDNQSGDVRAQSTTTADSTVTSKLELSLSQSPVDEEVMGNQDKMELEILPEVKKSSYATERKAREMKTDIWAAADTWDDCKETSERIDEQSIADQDVTVQQWETSLSPNKIDAQFISKGNDKSIKLYSENVVQEIDTTESIDRESISNLASIKQQWEHLMTNEQNVKNKESLKSPAKKTVKHWEVTLSNSPSKKTTNGEVSNETMERPMTNGQESAIDREIRLAMEREDMLKREKEERQKLFDKQRGVNSIAVKYEAPVVETSPMFHEMTEADRGSEMQKQESIIQAELQEQQQREEEISRKLQNAALNSTRDNNVNLLIKTSIPSTESIIEQEIRIQQEREDEIARQRMSKSVANEAEVTTTSDEVFTQQTVTTVYAPPPQTENDEQSAVKDILYEDAIASTQHSGESLIAKELRETKEREEELQKQREASFTSMPKERINGAKKSTSSSSISSSQTFQPTVATTEWQKDVSPFIQTARRGSTESNASSHSNSKGSSNADQSGSVLVQPYQDDHEDDNRYRYVARSENPMQREIRLALERENELRARKGLPPLKPETDQEPQGKEEGEQSSSITNRSTKTHPSDQTMRRVASGTLQKEINIQKQRELVLRNQGIINTTSEERVGEQMKYVEVTGQDRVDSGKRNFNITKKTTIVVAPPPVGSNNNNGEKAVVDNVPAMKISTQSPAPSKDTPLNRRTSYGGAAFSYKESRPKAESNIESELREMREREAELKSQRAAAGITVAYDPSPENSPHGNESTNNNDSKEISPDQGHGGRKNLAAQWQQICRN